MFNNIKDKIICCIDKPLSNYERNFFTKFYQPLLSNAAVNLYYTLHSLINYTEIESKQVTITNLLKQTNLESLYDYNSCCSELEAFELIDVYERKLEEYNLYLIILKTLPTPYNYFNNPILNTMLLEKIGTERYQELISEYLIHSQDIKMFTKVTKTFDEVYANKESEISSWWVDTTSKTPQIKNPAFDYSYFEMLAYSKNILSREELKSPKIYEVINRIAWVFNLKEEEIIDVLIDSTINGVVDYQNISFNAKKLLDKKDVNIVKRVNVEPSSDDKVINVLNNHTPLEVVKHLYNTNLTPSEMLMFDKLMSSNNITRGVLNALIVYVMDKKNGEIPSYNYFLKILNTWKRKGVNNTKDALNIMQQVEPKKESNNAQKSIYDEYVNEVLKKEEKTKEDDVSLKELEDFFKSVK